VLVSPIAFQQVAWGERRFELDLTCWQIEESPSVAEDQPVSRQKEEEYFSYYGYPYYWTGPGIWGVGMYPRLLAMQEAGLAAGDTAAAQEDDRSRGNPHLRSAREVAGYRIHARDGDLGHVDDFLADDQSWAIRSIVVDTRSWWPGKRVLVAPESIVEVSWTQTSVRVDLTREAIKQRPAYEPA